MAAVLQTLAVLTFSGFLFSLSVGNDSPELNVLSHKTTRRTRLCTSIRLRFRDPAMPALQLIKKFHFPTSAGDSYAGCF